MFQNKTFQKRKKDSFRSSVPLQLVVRWSYLCSLVAVLGAFFGTCTARTHDWTEQQKSRKFGIKFLTKVECHLWSATTVLEGGNKEEVFNFKVFYPLSGLMVPEVWWCIMLCLLLPLGNHRVGGYRVGGW